ncbi:MAG TPA: sugar phosphate isomerase/epimerase family protein [Armatimonadota bacterium]|nr:sugar phosphate isomerase/epimerase family protein [Armatimonadota bacterium]
MKLSCQEGLAPGGSFAEKLKNLADYGFDGVELNGGQLEGAGLEERKAALKDSPVRASSICGGCPAELVHPDAGRRRKCADALKRMLDIAAEFGARGPITVPIFNSNDRIPDLSPYKSRGDLEKELLIRMLQDLAPYGEQRGVAVLLEPLNRYESNALSRVEDAAAICRAVGGTGVRVMADFFHMHIEQTNTPAAFEAIGDTIGHVHLADNTRKEPGTGDIDFKAGFAALKKIGFDGYMAFECGLSAPAAEALPRSVRYLRACLS